MGRFFFVGGWKNVPDTLETPVPVTTILVSHFLIAHNKKCSEKKNTPIKQHKRSVTFHFNRTSALLRRVAVKGPIHCAHPQGINPTPIYIDYHSYPFQISILTLTIFCFIVHWHRFVYSYFFKLFKPPFLHPNNTQKMDIYCQNIVFFLLKIVPFLRISNKKTGCWTMPPLMSPNTTNKRSDESKQLRTQKTDQKENQPLWEDMDKPPILPISFITSNETDPMKKKTVRRKDV